jgi:hypothetical protein
MLKYNLDDLQIKGEKQIYGKGGKVAGKMIDSDYSFEDIYALKNKTYACVTKYDRKADKNSIYMQEIADDGNLVGSLRKLSDISSTSRRNSGSFNVFTSEDSTKILVVNNPPYEKYGGEKFEFKIFDENLEENITSPLHSLTKTRISLPKNTSWVMTGTSTCWHRYSQKNVTEKIKRKQNTITKFWLSIQTERDKLPNMKLSYRVNTSPIYPTAYRTTNSSVPDFTEM